MLNKERDSSPVFCFPLSHLVPWALEVRPGPQENLCVHLLTSLWSSSSDFLHQMDEPLEMHFFFCTMYWFLWTAWSLSPPKDWILKDVSYFFLHDYKCFVAVALKSFICGASNLHEDLVEAGHCFLGINLLCIYIHLYLAFYWLTGLQRTTQQPHF